MICPGRRRELAPPLPPGERDDWDTRSGRRVCSCCGSLHPHDFMVAVRRGCEVMPRDDPQRCSVVVDGVELSFTLCHLTMERREEFVAMYNDGSMVIRGEDFATDPYFFRFEPETADG